MSLRNTFRIKKFQNKYSLLNLDKVKNQFPQAEKKISESCIYKQQSHLGLFGHNPQVSVGFEE
jgi:hypothetical protein